MPRVAPAVHATRCHHRDMGTRGRRAVIAGCALVMAALAGCGSSSSTPTRTGDDGGEVTGVLGGAPDGTVPSVFGHTRESAGLLLEERGLDVRFDKQVSCDPAGRPVGTEPATGVSVEPGDVVTVLLAHQSATTDCAADLGRPWQFVDFATGRGPSPRFADEVVLFVDGARTGTLSGEDAASGAWGAGSALDILRRGSEAVVRTGSSYVMPQLQVTPGTPPDAWCGVARPREVADREALTLSIEFTEGVEGPRCPPRVALYDTEGAIDSVVAWSEDARGSDLAPIPDVVGLAVAEARDAVTAAGHPARVVEQETCHPRPGVVEQAPTQRALDEDGEDGSGWTGPVTLVVEVPHTVRDCAALDAAASDFRRFARGGAPPRWAPEVQQLLGYALWDTVSSTAASDPATWSLCSGVAPEDCGVSPLVVARGDDTIETGEFSDVTRFPDGQYCELIDRGGLPSGLAVESQIVMYPAELESCDDNWEVWLWIDDLGRIATVNLLVPDA